jgi:hypothetical protein
MKCFEDGILWQVHETASIARAREIFSEMMLPNMSHDKKRAQ